MRFSQRQLWTSMVLTVLMVLTRGSHVGSASLLPDATLAVMMLGGMLLQGSFWFAALMTLAVAIDAFSVGVVGVSSYCLSSAYWALLPTYAVMWLGGVWLSKRNLGFNALPYASVALATTSLAFIISTHSFYLFSGRFQTASVWEVLQHGWEYFPPYLGYTLMYLGAAWAIRQAASIVGSTAKSKAV